MRQPVITDDGADRNPSADVDRDPAPKVPAHEVLWAERAGALVDWFRPWTGIREGSLAGADVRWFPGARVNATFNCLDRHLERRGNRAALVWEGDAEDEIRRWTFRELHDEVARFANALKGIGVRRGDRVCLYLPVIPEAVIAMLACARIGAVHAVVYAGFSPDALAERLVDAGCSVLVTADHAMRSGRRVPLKASADIACRDIETVRRVVVVRRGPDSDPPWQEGRDLWYDELVHRASADCAAVELEATDPLFILYTSGSAGKPKGVVHACGGYLVHVTASFADVFGRRAREGAGSGAGSGNDGTGVHWCTADPGWITAHSYGVYGPLANGVTTLLYEGAPAWPDAGRWWRIVERHAVTTLYTAPTSLRTLKAAGPAWLAGTDRSSLRLLASVGEPIDAAARDWYARDVGGDRCPVIDTWWQTETGGIVMASDAHAPPGTAMRALPGLVPGLASDDELVLEETWPGQATTLWGDHERYAATYLSRHPGRWTTGDGARRDADGGWHLTGRLDDVLELDGVRVPAASIEAALAGHPLVAEAAVVGSRAPDAPGEGGRPRVQARVQAWVRTMSGVTGDDALRAELDERVRDAIGTFAVPERTRFAARLPKTRSGKTMRRMLKCIARHEFDDLGDTSTLADPGVVDALVADELASAAPEAP